MTSGHYDKKFYETNCPDSTTSAQIVLNHVLNLIPGVESVVDVGCGTGVWLSVLKEKGVKTIQGYDGNWVLGAEAPAIPRECFSAVDLNKSFEVEQEIRPGHVHGGGRRTPRAQEICELRPLLDTPVGHRAFLSGRAGARRNQSHRLPPPAKTEVADFHELWGWQAAGRRECQHRPQACPEIADRRTLFNERMETLFKHPRYHFQNQ